MIAHRRNQLHHRMSFCASLLAFGILAACSDAAAAGLRGRVADEAGRPVADAIVTIAEVSRRVSTGADGAYAFDDLLPGRYTISVRRSGYAPFVATPIVDQGTTLEITLRITPFVIEPVVVSETRTAADPNRVPYPVSTLSTDRLRKRQSVSLAHVTEELPGVRTLSTGAQVGKPVIRGLSGPRVLVLDEGMRLEDYSWSDEDGPSIDARLTERVEVVRGPASLLYGSDALAGVVNALPRPLPDARDGLMGPRVGGEVYGGSNNAELGAAIRYEGASEPLGWRLTVVGRRAEDLHTPDGELHNTGFEAANGDLAIGTRGANGSLDLRYTRYGGEFKLLEAEGPANAAEEEGPERKTADDRVQVSATRQIGAIRWEARGHWQMHSLIELADEPGATPGSGKESEQFNLLLNTWSLDVLGHHGGGSRTGTFGVSGFTQTNDTRGPIPLVPDASLYGGAAFAVEQWHRGAWDVLGGLRVDGHHVDADPNTDLAFAGDTRDDAEVSGDVGTVFHVDPTWSLSANVGRAWRAPTLFERYTNGPHLGEARFEIGNPELDPETGWSTDGGLHLTTARARGQVHGFWNRYSNFVFLEATGTQQSGLDVYRYRQAAATMVGAELELDVDVAGAFTAHAQVEATRGDNDETDTPLPQIPPLRGIVGGDFHFVPSWARELTLGVRSEMVARQERLSAFDVSTAPYALFHLDASMRRDLWGHPISLDVDVHNLADTRYRDFLSRYKTFALDPGRNVVVRLSTML